MSRQDALSGVTKNNSAQGGAARNAKALRRENVAQLRCDRFSCKPRQEPGLPPGVGRNFWRRMRQREAQSAERETWRGSAATVSCGSRQDARSRMN